MDALTDFAREDPALQRWLEPRLRRRSSDRRKAVAKRALRLLESLRAMSEERCLGPRHVRPLSTGRVAATRSAPSAATNRIARSALVQRSMASSVSRA
jgi:hypothetical protein